MHFYESFYLAAARFVCVMALTSAVPAEAAGTFADWARGCAGVFIPNAIFRGTDTDLIGRWIKLPDHRGIYQILKVEARTIDIEWFDFELMRSRISTVARPTKIALAGLAAIARRQSQLDRIRPRMTARNEELKASLLRLDTSPGPARVLDVGLGHLDIEYVSPETFGFVRATIPMPFVLESIRNLTFAQLSARAHLVADRPWLRPDTYVFFAPGVDVEYVSDSSTVAGPAIRFGYPEPWDVPHRRELLDHFASGGAVHFRVAEVDLIKNEFTLASANGSVRLPIREDVLNSARIAASPLGALNELEPGLQYEGFRLFRAALLAGDLLPGTAVLAFEQDDQDILKCPREHTRNLRIYRIESVGPDYVNVTMGTERFALVGVRALAGLSLLYVEKVLSAEQIGALYDEEYRRISVAALSPGDILLVERELRAAGFDAARFRHYLNRLGNLGSGPFFWPGRTAGEEWRDLRVTLHQSSLAEKSPATQKFAAEVYARATAAARELRGFSERR